MNAQNHNPKSEESFIRLDEIIAKIDADECLSKGECRQLLALEDYAELQSFYDAAYRVKLRHVGNRVYYRGLIECSNICIKDCFYCGIRKSNGKVERYQMDEDEIVREAIWSHQQGYGSVVIQAGERQDAGFVDKVERVLHRIHDGCQGELGITLSLGEQRESTYRRWYAAGAQRYLLRIETSSPHIYWLMHPGNHSYEERLSCLENLRQIGYQVGTGVMIGLPHQTLDDLVNDVIFMRSKDVDMVGMGPYIPHGDTPLGKDRAGLDREQKRKALQMGLKMVALARIVLKDVNIAATTALQALDSSGREKALLCGANVLMPNVTDLQYRSGYQLYEDKPCMEEDASLCQACLSRRVEGIGEVVAKNEKGDSPHWHKRMIRARLPKI
jgi:biotin synthase